MKNIDKEATTDNPGILCSVLAFLASKNNTIMFGFSGKVRKTLVFDKYLKFCMDSNIKNPLGRNKFCNSMKLNGHKIYKSNGVLYWVKK